MASGAWANMGEDFALSKTRVLLMLDSAKLVMAPGSEHKGAWTFLIRA